MMTLLLVEDNEMLRPTMARGLQETGAVEVVATCASGEEAVDYCLEQSPEVVLRDML